MKVYQQTTYESCLACSLLMAVGEDIDREKELELWKSGWDFKFMIGQFNKVAEDYSKELEVYIEWKAYFDYFKEQAVKGVNVYKSRVDGDLIKKILSKGRAVLYSDYYYTYMGEAHKPRWRGHFPHAVLALEITKSGRVKVADPYDGKLHYFKMSRLEDSIEGLRKLKFSPVLIGVYD